MSDFDTLAEQEAFDIGCHSGYVEMAITACDRILDALPDGEREPVLRYLLTKKAPNDIQA